MKITILKNYVIKVEAKGTITLLMNRMPAFNGKNMFQILQDGYGNPKALSNHLSDVPDSIEEFVELLRDDIAGVFSLHFGPVVWLKSK